MALPTHPNAFAAYCLAAALALIAATAQADSPAPPSTTQVPNGAVLMAWTQVVGNNDSSDADVMPLDGVARFILQGFDPSSCKNFKLGYTTAANANIAYTSVVDARTNPDTANFPVTVCEFTFDPGWTSATLYQASNGDPVYLNYYDTSGNLKSDHPATFPTLYDVGRKNNGTLRLVTTADTGCRNNSDTSSKNYQLCDSQQWPLQAVIHDMAGRTPDLAIHAGDLRYRGQHVDDAIDTWADWYQDFLYPATEMLFTTAWAITRGNHEVCSGDTNAGNGWYYFVDHHKAADNVDCGNEGSASPWYFDIAVKQTQNGQTQTTANFTTMNDWADDATDTAWWVMHRPIWGISTDGGLSTRTGTLQKNLHKAMNGTGNAHPDCNPAANNNGWLGGKWSYDQTTCHLRTALSGHSHIMEISRFYEHEGDTGGVWQRPQQAVTGHGGVNLDPSLKKSPCTIDIDGMSTTITWGDYWGYIYWERETDIAASGNQSGWNMQKIKVQGSDPDTTNDPGDCKVSS